MAPRPKTARRRYFFRAWRKYRGKTQKQLADVTGLTEATISQLEGGKQGFTDTTLELMAHALMCSPGDLLMRNPLDDSAPWTIWETLKPAERKQAVAILEALKKTGTE